IWYAKAITFFYSQRFAEALTSFNHLLAIKPDYIAKPPDYQGALDQLDVGWCAKGVMLIFLQRFEEANIAFDYAIKLVPNHYHSWAGKTLALEYLGRLQEALGASEKAIA